MKDFSVLKSELLDINHCLTQLISSAKNIPGLSDSTFIDWEKTSGNLKDHLAEDIIRVATVGSIKSGKSTFVNSLLKSDFLKRGAGVVTSFVTKVRYGNELSAKLVFKSFDEVNDDIKPALVLIPYFDSQISKDEFDIRSEKDRMSLQEALDSLSDEHLVTNGLRNINGVLLSCYLEGYKDIKSVLSEEPTTIQYGEDAFFEHHKYVGDETLAVYLKDIELNVNSDNLESNFEIADCQGSDSSNPLHLAMIQDYLVQTNLIIYVISSRTGIRRADIRFLSMIKKMGIMDNVLFVMNCDFSEHDSLENLKSLIEKTEKEIALMKPVHEMYTFSVLFDLFSNQEADLSEKDSSRLAQWEKEPDFIELSVREFSRFQTDLQQILKMKHISLLLKNNLERHGVMVAGMSNWVRINQDLISADKNRVNDIDKWVKRQHKQMSQIKSVVDSALKGAEAKIKRELNSNVNRFFDVRSGGVLEDIIEFIRSYRITYEDLDTDLNESSLSKTVYLIYQLFKQELDDFVTKVFNPGIVRFIKDEELRIFDHFQSLSEPFETLVEDALIESNERLKDIGITRANQEDLARRVMLLELNLVKANSNLTLPPFVASMRLSVKLKTDAVLRFGFYSMIRVCRKLLKRSTVAPKKNKVKALKGVVKVMKRETEKSYLQYVKNYSANIRFQYLHKFVDETSIFFNEALTEGFQIYISGLSGMVKGVKNKQVDKEQTFETLAEMEKSLNVTNGMINSLRKQIDSITTSPYKDYSH